MASKVVKENLDDEKPTPLNLAARAQDEFVAGVGDSVVRTLHEILLHGSKEDGARVQAGKVLLEWMRPKKPMTVAINNAPQFVSHLGLPPAPSVVEEPPLIDVRRVEPPEIQRVLPEKGDSLRAAKLTLLEAPKDPEAASVPALPSREQEPRSPDMPPKAATVRQY